MRIERTSGPNTMASVNTARRSAGDGFAVSDAESARAPAANAGIRSIGSIDVLVALQGIDDPRERRRRAVRRGRAALDALDALKLGLLEGACDAGTVGKLKAAACGLTDGSGDPILDGVLAEIELRLEVEIAKIEPAAARYL
jgi:hypothetical protein